MTGLKDLAAEHGVKAAYIPVIIGGVDGAMIEVARPSADSPVGVVAKKIELTGPIAICGAQGMIRKVCRERDIPVLFIDLDYNDDRVLSKELLRSQVEDFFTTVMA